MHKVIGIVHHRLGTASLSLIFISSTEFQCTNVTTEYILWVRRRFKKKIVSLKLLLTLQP